jgi:hypothetical protein
MTKETSKAEPVLVAPYEVTEETSAVEKAFLEEAAALGISAERIHALRQDAAKLAVEKQVKEWEKRYKDMRSQMEMSKVDPSEEIVEYTPDFPISNVIYKNNIKGATFNFTPYENGKTYHIPISLWRMLAYQEFMAKKNERGLNLRDRDAVPNIHISQPGSVPMVKV